MPIHDWRTVIAGIFHDFHQAWITEIRNILNEKLLPQGFYALADQVASGPHPDVLTLEAVPEAIDEDAFPSSGQGQATLTAVAESPPSIRYTLKSEESLYASRANRVAIYHATGDRVVAFLKIISPGNKHTKRAMEQLIDKLSTALARGCHLIVIDLFPPGSFDPQGLHAEIWGKLDPPFDPREPLVLASYQATPSPVAYIEPTAIGKRLVDMPLFLTDEHYINVPLEQTYEAAWAGVPDRWKRVIASHSSLKT